MSTERDDTELKPISPSIGRESLDALGYRLKDDAWNADGRRTYLHEDDATRGYLGVLCRWLDGYGWHRDASALRTFRHEATSELIEIEPAGSDCSGHYLHHMTAAAGA